MADLTNLNLAQRRLVVDALQSYADDHVEVGAVDPKVAELRALADGLADGLPSELTPELTDKAFIDRIDGVEVLRCGTCGATDVEQEDVGARSSRPSVGYDGEAWTVTWHPIDSGHWETKAVACTACGNTLTMVEEFEGCPIDEEQG